MKLDQNINQFGAKYFGNEFHNKINQNTKESMNILTDPSIPKVANFTNRENQLLLVFLI